MTAIMHFTTSSNLLQVSLITNIGTKSFRYWDVSSHITDFFEPDEKGGNRIYVLLFLLALACYFDYHEDRIPNVLVITGAVLAVIYRLLICCLGTGAGQSLLVAIAAGLGGLFLWMGIVFVLLYPFYKLGMLGAGDVKLYSVAAAFFAGKGCMTFLTGSMMIAAVLALLKLLYERNVKDRLYYFCSYLADVLKYGSLRLYLREMDVSERKRASLHMAGPMLLGCIFYLCSVN